MELYTMYSGVSFPHRIQDVRMTCLFMTQEEYLSMKIVCVTIHIKYFLLICIINEKVYMCVYL